MSRFFADINPHPDKKNHIELAAVVDNERVYLGHRPNIDRDFGLSSKSSNNTDFPVGENFCAITLKEEW